MGLRREQDFKVPVFKMSNGAQLFRCSGAARFHSRILNADGLIN